MDFKKNTTGRRNFSNLYLSVFILTGFLMRGAAHAAGAWEYSGADIRDISADVVVCSSDNTDSVYAASEGILYKTEDAGRKWKVLFEAQGADKTINHIFMDTSNPPSFFAATSDGLYASSDGGKNWQRAFTGSGEEENNITYTAKGQDGLFICTSDGIFLRRENTSGWTEITQGTTIRRAVCVLIKDDAVYAATDSGIYKAADDFGGWVKLYSVQAPEALSAEEEAETEEALLRINFLAAGVNEIYAATDRGVLASADSGKSWQYMTTSGLAPAKVKHLVISAGERIFAATFDGVFEYVRSDGIWQQLYRGATFRDAKFLALNSREDTLWAATGAGLFKMKLNDASAALDKSLRQVMFFENEPAIQELQKIAVTYAEVHPDKIKNWRRQARVRAILPEFSLDYDKTLNYNSGDDAYRLGPRDWGISLSWDIADFVYSNDQTSIDVRSRLTTQLRDDILDDLNRLYFERRRLQIELQTVPPEKHKDRFEKELRIEELTAGIDALTGGWFSLQLDKNN